MEKVKIHNCFESSNLEPIDIVSSKFPTVLGK